MTMVQLLATSMGSQTCGGRYVSCKKAVVLSGGGGQGAYHVGVVEALVEPGWMEDGNGPDVLSGTSIGAINAAALASGMTVVGCYEEQIHEKLFAMGKADALNALIQRSIT